MSVTFSLFSNCADVSTDGLILVHNVSVCCVDWLWREDVLISVCTTAFKMSARQGNICLWLLSAVRLWMLTKKSMVGHMGLRSHRLQTLVRESSFKTKQFASLTQLLVRKKKNNTVPKQHTHTHCWWCSRDVCEVCVKPPLTPVVT